MSLFLMTITFHSHKILIADMLNSKIMFTPLYIIAMMLFYVEVIQIIITGIFSLDLSNEFGLANLFTGDILLLRHLVNGNILRILYFLLKSTSVLLSIVVNVKYRKTKFSFIFVSLFFANFSS
jgi:hypothetical protein